MNRRELFKGMAAALAALSIPVTVDALIEQPDDKIMQYLLRVRLDLINKLAFPPLIMKEDGTMYKMPTKIWEEALAHVNQCMKQLELT